MAAAAPWHLAGEAASLSRLLPARPQRPSPGQGAPRHPHRRLGRQDRSSPPQNPIRAMFLWDRLASLARAVPVIQWLVLVVGMCGSRVAYVALATRGGSRREAIEPMSWEPVLL